MIRNVVMGRLGTAPGAEEQLEAGLAGIVGLDLPGMLANHVGRDAGLRAGGWDFAITNDWADAASYQAYDIDPEHNVHRARVVEVCEQVARVQLEIPDA